MRYSIRLQLSVMMFLNFFVWGIWFVTLGTYLSTVIKATDVEIGLAYGTQALGAIIAPFIIGLIADRYFAAQKILGVLHLAGAAILYVLSTVHTFDEFYPLLLIYMILFMPSLALVNAISFKQMDSPEKEFGSIRVLGTIGWIVQGFVITWLALEAKQLLSQTFIISCILSAVLGVYSFFLPNTPPPKAGTKTTFKEIIGWDALKLLKEKNYLIFFISSVLICIPLAFYYQETNLFLNELNIKDAASKMTLGQMSETIFLFMMPFFFKRFGIKKMLLIGMMAWVIRYICFGFSDANTAVWLLYTGIILHGICYDFFFVTGQVYTDEKAGTSIRSSAQGMITLATYGVGMLIGFWFAGIIAGKHEIKDGLKQAGISKNTIVKSINNNEVKDSTGLVAVTQNLKPGDAIQIAFVQNGETKTSEVKLKTYPSYYTRSLNETAQGKLGVDFVNSNDGVLVTSVRSSHAWDKVWMIPAYIALGVTLLFALLFKEKKKVSAA